MSNQVVVPERVIDPMEVAERNLKQLQHEASITRMKTSEAIASLMSYVEGHQESDHLIIGFNDEDTMKKNPYKRERLNKCSMM